MTMIKVEDPKDDVELNYALESVILAAKENGVEEHKIEDILGNYQKAVKEGRV